MSNSSLISKSSAFPSINLIKGMQTIGRSKETQISDPRISRKHIQIELLDNSAVITQLVPGSSVRINTTPLIQNVPLTMNAGDTVSIISLCDYEFTITQPIVVQPMIVLPTIAQPPAIQPIQPTIIQPSVHKLIGQIKDEYICPICQEICLYCHSCPCGHISCKECLLEWLGMNEKCPTCRLSCNSSQIVPIRALDVTIESLLMHIKNSVDVEVDDLQEAIAWYLERKQLIAIRLADDAIDKKKKKKKKEDADDVDVDEHKDDDDDNFTVIVSISSPSMCYYCDKKFSKSAVCIQVKYPLESSIHLHSTCLADYNDQLLEDDTPTKVIRYNHIKDLPSFKSLSRNQRDKLEDILVEYIETGDDWDDDDSDDEESDSYSDDDDDDDYDKKRKYAEKRADDDDYDLKRKYAEKRADDDDYDEKSKKKKKKIEPVEAKPSSSSSSSTRVLPAWMMKKKK